MPTFLDRLAAEEEAELKRQKQQSPPEPTPPPASTTVIPEGIDWHKAAVEDGVSPSANTPTTVIPEGIDWHKAAVGAGVSPSANPPKPKKVTIDLDHPAVEWFARAQGAPYLYGGTDKRRGIDCSAAMQQSFATIGVKLPRTADEQFHSTMRVDPGQVRPGDMVFFKGTNSKKPGKITHVGIVAANGIMGNASSNGVGFESYNTPYWRKRIAGFGRPKGGQRETISERMLQPGAAGLNLPESWREKPAPKKSISVQVTEPKQPPNRFSSWVELATPDPKVEKQLAEEERRNTQRLAREEERRLLTNTKLDWDANPLTLAKKLYALRKLDNNMQDTPSGMLERKMRSFDIGALQSLHDSALKAGNTELSSAVKRVIEQTTPSPGAEAMQGLDWRTAEFWKRGILQGGITDMAANQIGNQSDLMATTALLTLLSGGVVGASSGVLSTVIPTATAAAGTFLSDFKMEDASTYSQMLAEAGAPLSDADSLASWVKDNPAQVAKAKAIAHKRGVAVGKTDAMFTLLAGGVLLRTASKARRLAEVGQELSRGQKALAGGTVAGLEFLSEPGSERSGLKAQGKDLSSPESIRAMGEEAIYGLGTSATMTAAQLAATGALATPQIAAKAVKVATTPEGPEAWHPRAFAKRPRITEAKPVDGGFQVSVDDVPIPEVIPAASTKEAVNAAREHPAYHLAALKNAVRATPGLSGATVDFTDDGALRFVGKNGAEGIVRRATAEEAQAKRDANQASADISSRQGGGKKVAGWYENGTLTLVDGASIDDVSHEVAHWTRDIGLVTDEEFETVVRWAAKSDPARAKRIAQFEEQAVQGDAAAARMLTLERDEAFAFAVQTYTQRQMAPASVRSVLERIREIWHRITNVDYRAARGVMQDMHTGRVVNRAIPGAQPQTASPATPAAPAAPTPAPAAAPTVTPPLTPPSTPEPAPQATPAPRPAATPPARPAPTGEPGWQPLPEVVPEMRTMDVNDIHVHPGMQYKSQGIVDPKNKVTAQFKGLNEFNTQAAGVGSVWEALDGTVYAGDFHHRLELAKRAKRWVGDKADGGSGEVPRGKLIVKVYREADGWTLELARGKFALDNIRDGKGTAVDAVRAMKDLKLRRDDMLSRGVSEKSKLYRNIVGLFNLSDDLFGAVANGTVPEDVAAGIGEVTLDPGMQKLFIESAKAVGIKTYDDALAYAEDAQREVVEAKKSPQVELPGGADAGWQVTSAFADVVAHRTLLLKQLKNAVEAQRREALRPVSVKELENEFIDRARREEIAKAIGETRGAAKDKLDLAYQRNEAFRERLTEAAKRIGRGESTVASEVASLLDPTLDLIQQSIAVIIGRSTEQDTGSVQVGGRTPGGGDGDVQGVHGRPGTPGDTDQGLASEAREVDTLSGDLFGEEPARDAESHKGGAPNVEAPKAPKVGGAHPVQSALEGLDVDSVAPLAPGKSTAFGKLVAALQGQDEALPGLHYLVNTYSQLRDDQTNTGMRKERLRELLAVGRAEIADPELGKAKHKAMADPALENADEATFRTLLEAQDIDTLDYMMDYIKAQKEATDTAVARSLEQESKSKPTPKAPWQMTRGEWEEQMRETYYAAYEEGMNSAARTVLSNNNTELIRRVLGEGITSPKDLRRWWFEENGKYVAHNGEQIARAQKKGIPYRSQTLLQMLSTKGIFGDTDRAEALRKDLLAFHRVMTDPEVEAERRSLITIHTLQSLGTQEHGGHRQFVADAVGDGKPVPPEVLAEYPGLKPPAQPEAAPTAPAKQPWEMTDTYVRTRAAAVKDFPIESTVEIRNGKPVYTISTTLPWGDSTRTFKIEGRSQSSDPAGRLHTKVIEAALAEGKPVPPAVGNTAKLNAIIRALQKKGHKSFWVTTPVGLREINSADQLQITNDGVVRFFANSQATIPQMELDRIAREVGMDIPAATAQPDTATKARDAERHAVTPDVTPATKAPPETETSERPAPDTSADSGEADAAVTSKPPEPDTQDPRLEALLATEDDIPLEAAVDAHRWSSMNPEDRGRSAQTDYAFNLNHHLQALWDKFTSDEQRAMIAEQWPAIRERFRQNYLTMLARRGRTASAYVTGPSKFPTARNKKALDAEAAAERKLYDDFNQAHDRLQSQLRKTGSALEDMLAKYFGTSMVDHVGMSGTRNYGKERKDALKSVIRRNVKTIGRIHGAEGRNRARAALRAAQDQTGVALFPPSDRIWGDPTDIPGDTKPPASGEELLAKYDGATVLVNFDEDRVQIDFKAKPNETLRAALKGAGWHWSPRNGVWQRKFTEAAELSAESILRKFMKKDESAVPGPNTYEGRLRGVRPDLNPPAADENPDVRFAMRGLFDDEDIPVAKISGRIYGIQYKFLTPADLKQYGLERLKGFSTEKGPQEFVRVLDSRDALTPQEMAELGVFEVPDPYVKATFRPGERRIALNPPCTCRYEGKGQWSKYDGGQWQLPKAIAPEIARQWMADTKRNRQALAIRLGGELIDPSNPPKYQRTLFAVIGEQGAKEAERKNLEVAKEMKAKGLDHTTIWLATGWQLGKDGKWRAEQGDKTARLIGDGLRLRDVRRDLEDILHFPALYDRYPNLAKVRVVMNSRPHPDAWTGAAYLARPSLPGFRESERIHETHGIVLWPHAFRDRRTLLNIPDGNLMPQDVRVRRSTLLHEVQHIIQTIEGFAKHEPGYEQPRADAIDDFDSYQKQPGEVEARLVQARQDMPAIERKATPLSESADVKGVLFDDEPVRFAVIPDEDAPKRTVKAYKLFQRGKDGGLYPLKFPDKGKPIPVGVWIEAEVKPKKAGFAHRPGWHAGRLPDAAWLRQRSTGDYADNRVWAEVEVSADVDWQPVADASKSKDIKHDIPRGGMYRFPRPATQGGEWVIAGTMRINRVLTPDEVQSILADAKDDVRFATREEQEEWGSVWYSRLQKHLREKLPKRIRADDLRRMVEKGGFSADELEYTGFNALIADLETQGGDSLISKEYVDDWLNQGMLLVGEVTKAFPSPETASREWKRAARETWSVIQRELVRAEDSLPWDVEEVRAQWNNPAISIDDSDILDGTQAKRNSDNYRMEKVRWAIDDRNRAIEDELRVSAPTYAKYTAPGGEGYREFLFTLPKEYSAYTPLRTHSFIASKDRYQSPHFTGYNIVAHARFKIRGDALFLEELQSDWHQEGREKGYKTFPEETAEEAIRMARQSVHDTSNAPPPGPFSKTWPRMVLRRMLRWAAEHGLKRIAWTSGDMQNGRYNLEAVAKRLSYRESDNTLIVDTVENRVKTFKVTAEQLPDYIGKEAAETLLSQPFIRYRAEKHETYYAIVDTLGRQIDRFRILPEDPGIAKKRAEARAEELDRTDPLRVMNVANMRVGGSGMQTFYDQMLPSEMNKIVKRWGEKVQVEHVDDDVGTVPTVHITPQMREDILREGMPLFATRREDPEPDQKSLFDDVDVVVEEGLKYIGSQNVTLMDWDTFDDGKAVLQGMGELFDDSREAIRQQRRGVQTWSETRALAQAKALGITPKMLARIKPGTAFNAENATALRMAFMHLARKWEDAQRTFAASGTVEDMAARDLALAEWKVAMLAAQGAPTEAGRSLQAYKMMAQEVRRLGSKKDLLYQRLLELRGPVDDALMIAIADIPDNDTVALFRILNNAAKAQAKWGDHVHTVLYCNMLSSLNPHGMNFLGNLSHTLLERAAYAGAAGVDAARSAITGKKREVYFVPALRRAARAKAFYDVAGTLGRALNRGVTLAREGFTVEQAERFDIPHGHSLPTIRINGKDYQNPYEWPLRGLGSADEIQRSIAEQISINDSCVTIAINNLKENPERSGVDEIAEEAIRVRDNLIEHPEVIEEAKRQGDRILLTSPPGDQMLEPFMKMINGEVLNTGLRPLKLVVPFVRVAANASKRGMEWGPLGTLELLNKDLSVKERELVISRAMLGTLAMAGLYTAAMAGAIDIQGEEPEGTGERSLQEASGRRGWSIRIPGTNRWVPLYISGVLAPMLYGVAAAVDATKAGRNDKEVQTAFWGGFRGIYKGVMDQSYMQGLTTVLNALADSGGRWQNYVDSAVGNVMGQFVPQGGLVGQVANATDKTRRDTRRWGDDKSLLGPAVSRVKSRVPGFRQTLPPSVDVLGREMPQNPTGIAAFSKLVGTSERPDPVADELLRLGWAPGYVGKEFSRDKVTYKLTRQQWLDYQKQAGTLAYSRLASLFESDRYRDASEEQKVEMAQREVTNTRARVREQIKRKVMTAQ